MHHISCRHIIHPTKKLRYYLRTKAAADAIKFTVEVGGCFTKVVEASSNAWKVLFFFKPAFFMGKRARGSEVPHCSGDFYQTFGCQVQKLKTEETAIKVSCMRCLGGDGGDVIFWMQWLELLKMKPSAGQFFFFRWLFWGLEIRSSQVFLRGMQCLSARWVLVCRRHFPRLFLRIFNRNDGLFEGKDAHHLVGIGFSPRSWGGTRGELCETLLRLETGGLFRIKYWCDFWVLQGSSEHLARTETRCCQMTLGGVFWLW